VGGDDPSHHRRKVSQKTNYLEGNFEEQVKRRGKSPPLQAQARRHDKPYAVQDKQENRPSAWMFLALCETRLRVRRIDFKSTAIAQRNDHPNVEQSTLDRIRLIANSESGGNITLVFCSVWQKL